MWSGPDSCVYYALQAVALVQGGDVQQQIGLAAGTAVTAVLLVRGGKRFVDTPDDPSGASSATAALHCHFTAVESTG